jgi:hypothetical protein
MKLSISCETNTNAKQKPTNLIKDTGKPSKTESNAAPEQKNLLSPYETNSWTSRSETIFIQLHCSQQETNNSVTTKDKLKNSSSQNTTVCNPRPYLKLRILQLLHHH